MIHKQGTHTMQLKTLTGIIIETKTGIQSSVVLA